MANARTIGGAVALVLEAGLAGFGVLVHYGLTAEYGNIKDSAIEATISGFTTGMGDIALVLVGAVALVAFLVSPSHGMRAAAVLLPIGMVLGMFAVTPAALKEKLSVQYHATPECFSSGDEREWGGRRSPGLRAARESQQAFESIDHVVLFHGGGASGVGGCYRGFVVMDQDVDVLEHYRAALPQAGWRIVENKATHVRAEQDQMAFEVIRCGEDGVVWAGRRETRDGARCLDDGTVAEIAG